MNPRKLCFGNWKLQKGPQEAKAFLKEFLSFSKPEERKDFCIFPSALSAFVFTEKELFWGGQNVYSEDSGAYTGENSADILKSMGASFVLVGHSERRSLFKESNDFLNKKIKNAVAKKLKIVYCIGESLEEREAGATLKVLEDQLSEGLKALNLDEIIVAYEPVWAIGSGKSASLAEVSEVHSWLREKLGSQISLLYGGSVKEANAKELYSDKNVDGFLIGGASLNPESFVNIYRQMGA